MLAAPPPPVRVALGPCPAHVRRLAARDLRTAQLAVQSAIRLPGAKVVQVRFTHRDGDVQPARPCAAISRSVLVQFHLPHVRDQSLAGNPEFYVARTPAAWVVWFRAH